MEMKKVEKRQRMEMKKADWSDLPNVILRLIMENLRWSERVSLCLVCKSWHKCFLEQEFLPWVMYFNRDQEDESGICNLYDPSTERNYTVKEAAIVKNKDFSGAKPCDSKYGWVLFSNNVDTMTHLFFYNPVINEVIQLPELEEENNYKVAYSLNPTSPDCVVIAFFTSVFERLLRIKICHPGDRYWTTIELCGIIFIHDVVYAGDSFYCIFTDSSRFSNKLRLGAFNVKQQQWKRFSSRSRLPLTWPMLSLVAAFNADLLLHKPFHRTPETILWRLKLPEEKWVDLERESVKKHVVFYCWYCPSFTIPAIGNARKCAGRKLRLSDHAFLNEHGRMIAIWVQPPFVKKFKRVNATRVFYKF